MCACEYSSSRTVAAVPDRKDAVDVLDGTFFTLDLLASMHVSYFLGKSCAF